LDVVTEANSCEPRAVPLYEGQQQDRLSIAGDDKSTTHASVDMGEVFRPKKIQSHKDRRSRRLAGRRSLTGSARKRGRYIRSRPAPGECDDIAFDATFRQAAPRQIRRQRADVAFAITSHDFHRKVRVRRTANLVLFVVDASWSMAAAARMEATKGAVMSLLIDAYQRRDRVGVVVFQKETAWEALPFTSSVELARRVLRNVPVGGKTPLSAGLLLAYKMISRELRSNSELMPLMIVLTDGAANVSMTGRTAMEESRIMAELMRYKEVRSVVVNMEQLSFDRGLAQDLAVALDGTCYNLRELKALSLYQTVQHELALQNMRGSGKGM
jgi:Mg-chelatase subunit ChlD